ncbi:hypothetical protein JYB64_20450 [Algoriphagus aestuarii]|nr:hypothetical protein [Algoriphagus aestuarii]
MKLIFKYLKMVFKPIIQLVLSEIFDFYQKIIPDLFNQDLKINFWLNYK